MGIIVADTLDVQYGFTTSNCYVNVVKVEIMKQLHTSIPEKYTILGSCRYFVNEEQRLSNDGTYFRETQIGIHTNDLDNVYEQVYTKLKSQFENYTDCI